MFIIISKKKEDLQGLCDTDDSTWCIGMEHLNILIVQVKNKKDFY